MDEIFIEGNVYVEANVFECENALISIVYVYREAIKKYFQK